MAAPDRSGASSPLDMALDVFRMRQYFDVMVRARDVASAVTKDIQFISAFLDIVPCLKYLGFNCICTHWITYN